MGKILVFAALLLAALCGLLFLLYYGYLKRLYLCVRHHKAFGKDTVGVFLPALTGREKVPLCIFAFVLALCSVNVLHMSGLFLLHLAAFIALLQLLYKVFGKKLPSAAVLLHWCGILPLLLSALVMALGYANLHHVTVTEYTVYTDKPIRAEGYTAVLIADMHYGVSLDDQKLEKVAEEISAFSPDAALLCGDIVDDQTPLGSIAPLFARLGAIRAKDGVYYAFGNHDRPFSFIRSGYTENDLRNAIQNAGITILQDKSTPLGSDILLAGREDNSRPDRMPVKELLSDIETGRFVLLMDHQPADYDQSAMFADLIVSGHTHGGQIFPLGQIMRLFGINDWVYGQTNWDSDTQIIVTSGFAGWRFPIKTNAPAEYAVIHIQPR
ncbi:MAG: metallophosphoesterase [Clostridia bacterium]|nr:metallophosphoesterase [Clostridia bacterium]